MNNHKVISVRVIRKCCTTSLVCDKKIKSRMNVLTEEKVQSIQVWSGMSLLKSLRYVAKENTVRMGSAVTLRKLITFSPYTMYKYEESAQAMRAESLYAS
jgi:hypothetical protein